MGKPTNHRDNRYQRQVTFQTLEPRVMLSADLPVHLQSCPEDEIVQVDSVDGFNTFATKHHPATFEAQLFQQPYVDWEFLIELFYLYESAFHLAHVSLITGNWLLPGGPAPAA